MGGSKKTIWFTAVASVILLLITYLVTLNIENNCLTANSPWISNEFFLTFFGGAFASMVVVSACEISKYKQAKLNAEAFIINHMYYLYGQLKIIEFNIMALSKQDGKDIPPKALSQLIANAEAEMNAIYFAEYCPFSKRNAFWAEKTKYNEDCMPSIQTFLQKCRFLEMAVLEDRILDIQQNDQASTTGNKKTHRVLGILAGMAGASIQQVDSMAIQMDELCNNRFKWKKTRDEFDNRLQKTQLESVDNFISRNEKEKS